MENAVLDKHHKIVHEYVKKFVCNISGKKWQGMAISMMLDHQDLDITLIFSEDYGQLFSKSIIICHVLMISE